MKDRNLLVTIEETQTVLYLQLNMKNADSIFEILDKNKILETVWNSENKLIGAGLLTAITASLCCITPVLALIAGTSGINIFLDRDLLDLT
jgi:hypothetical protein